MERETGNHMTTASEQGQCAVCDRDRKLDHVIAWNCGPTHDAIGSLSTELEDGVRPVVVGERKVCEECYDLHYGKGSVAEAVDHSGTYETTTELGWRM